MVLIGKTILFIGENLSEERLFPEPLSKDFKSKFSPDRALQVKFEFLLFLMSALSGLNLKLGSFRKGV